jgi:uncharacterized protein YjbI with pentapeptide repeats
MQKLAQWTKRKKLAQWTKRTLWIGVGSILVAEAIALLISQPAWTGFGPDSTKNIERDSTGKITKIVEVEQSGKTLWDLLNVLGVPFSLAILGFWFQQREQKRVDEQAELEKEIAAANQREEALQVYFDRLSTLLIDKNLIAIAAKVKAAEESQHNIATDEEKEQLNVAVNVIRARTLAILRQFGEDGERKSSVIRFLLEAEVIDKLNLNLSGADLSGSRFSGSRFSGSNLRGADLRGSIFIGADLSEADLSFAKLSGANFFRANFFRANFFRANLSGSDFSEADLSFAKLSNANLSNANLSGADLSDANLVDANLSFARKLKPEQLAQVMLCKTRLPEGCDLDPNRNCKELGIPTNNFD